VVNDVIVSHQIVKLQFDQKRCNDDTMFTLPNKILSFTHIIIFLVKQLAKIQANIEHYRDFSCIRYDINISKNCYLNANIDTITIILMSVIFRYSDPALVTMQRND